MQIITNTIVPERHKGLVRRQRLLDFLYQNLDRKLTLVAAAAGYGKTSLLVDFAHETELPVCWLTLDRDDDSPARFLAGLVASIHRRFSRFGKSTTSALQSGAPPRDVASVFVNDLVTNVSDFFVLVLDDYHQADSPENGLVLERLLTFLPPHCNLILSSRRTPSIDLIQMAARQEVVILPPQELCFEPAETAELLEKNPHLSADQVSAHDLTQNMQGWIAGIILATQRHVHLLSSAQETSGDALDVIYRYLAREVLDYQPQSVREFLLETSILRWMSVDLANTLLGRDDAEDILRLLESQHLFIERVDEETGVHFRFHPLFQEFLLQHLASLDEDRKNRLHRKAAGIFTQQNLLEEAVRHWLSIGELGEATPLVDRLAADLFSSGRHTLLVDWYHQLGSWMEKAPRLRLHVAKVWADQGDYQAALETLGALLLSPLDESIMADTRVQQAYVWYRQSETQRALDTLLPVLELSVDSRAHASALRIVGLCYHRQGALVKAKECLLEALGVYEQLKDAYNQSQVLLDLVLVLTSLGQTDEVIAFQEQALQILHAQGMQSSVALALNNAAYTYHQRGEFEKAISLYQDGLERAQESGQLRTAALVMVGQADLFRDVGQYDTAMDLYRRALDWLKSVNEPWLHDYTLTGLASCCRLSGELAQSRAWIDRVQEGMDAGLAANIKVERGSILVQSGELEEGVRLLTRGRDILAAQKAYPDLATTELRLGDAYLQAGNQEAAISALERAIEAYRRGQGDYRFFIEAPHHPALLALGERSAVNPPVLELVRHRARELDQVRLDLSGGASRISSSLRIFAFGQGRVIRNHQEITSADWKRPAARLIFLFIADHSPVQRDEIIRSFWPDVSHNRALARLHTALYEARGAVGPDRIIYTLSQGFYELQSDDGVWYDVTEFEKALAGADDHPLGKQRAKFLHQAVSVYSGPYLRDVDEEWADRRRRELEGAHLRALIDLGDCYYSEQDFQSAEKWYRQVLEIDSFREDIHRRVMLSLAQGGRRADALRQFEECAALLRQELGVEPDPMTISVLEQIKNR
jgi:LuxR family maltose regulon positive regulatory protein